MKKTVSKYVILFAAGFVFFGFYGLLGVDLHHDGIMFKTAYDAANGVPLFRGTFSQYGILTPFLQGLFIRIFGAELLVLRLLTAVFYGASLVVFELIREKIFKPGNRFSFALALLMFFFLSADCCVTAHPWASVYALFFQLGAIYCTLRYLEDNDGRKHFALLCGVSCGVAFGLRQPCGLTSMLAAYLFAILLFSCNRRKSLRFASFFTAGFFSCIVLYAVYITAVGAWSDYLKQTWIQAFSFAIKRGSANGELGYNAAMLNFFPLLTGDRGFIDAVFALFPLLSLGLLGYLILYKKWKDSLSVVVLLLYALGAWHQYYPVPCMRHLYWGAVPMMLIFVWCVDRFVRCGRWQGKAAAALCILCLAFPLFFRMYFSVYRIVKTPARVTTEVPGFRGLLLFKNEKAVAEIIYGTWQKLPADLKQRGVMNCSFDGIWSVLLKPCDFRSPVYCSLDSPGYPDREKEAFRYCMEKYPVVLASKWHTLPGYIKILTIQLNGVDYNLLIPLQ